MSARPLVALVEKMVYVSTHREALGAIVMTGMRRIKATSAWVSKKYLF